MAFEYVIITSLMIIMVTFLLHGISHYSQDYYSARDNYIVLDFAKSVQTEIKVVTSLEDGYIRNLYLPDKIQNSDYEINNTGKYLWVKRGGKEYVLRIPQVVGTLVKGNNTIEKIEDVICINC